jgi:restriction system protein
LDHLRETPWKDFEYLVAEAYRRQGYQVDYSMGRGADGGVDLTMRKDGLTSLVQCKQWKVFSVGAPVVREMFGLMTAEKADQAIIVTTGNFTRDARAFAAGKPVTLVDGSQLLALLQSLQTNRAEPESGTTPVPADPAIPACPLCGKPMVQRIARRGSNAGNRFWGCSAYPACKGIRN